MRALAAAAAMDWPRVSWPPVHGDACVGGGCGDGLAQGVLAAGFDDHVGAAVIRQGHELGGPVRMLAVVDGDVGTQLADDLQFFVAGGGDGDARAAQLGEFQCGQ